jgi:putative PEP-CTERM system histidine kinase
VGRHFREAQHDSVRVWGGLSKRLANVTDETALAASSAAFVSDTFQSLSVTAWLADERSGGLASCGSTTPRPERDPGGEPDARVASRAVADGLAGKSSPFDLDAVNEPWADEFKRLNPKTFTVKSVGRVCLPLTAGDRCLGALVLADRVDAVAYSAEDLALLACIADQVSSVLLNLRLAREVAFAREMEAFRTMSAFFVHDLKNSAASLNLTLKNLPVHFDNPAFREDALRTIGNTARRIDEIIGRLSALRQRPDVRLAAADLNEIVADTITRLAELRDAPLAQDLQPVPIIRADRDQVGSVVANLLLNARDAVAGGGAITVRTTPLVGRVMLTVADTGCGMTPEFLRDALFRPFQSTKKNGLGIGMFQARMIVEAHGGTIQAESAPGTGTTFRVSFPAGNEP